jgi:hypothetical protein
MATGWRIKYLPFYFSLCLSTNHPEQDFLGLQGGKEFEQSKISISIEVSSFRRFVFKSECSHFQENIGSNFFNYFVLDLLIPEHIN